MNKRAEIVETTVDGREYIEKYFILIPHKVSPHNEHSNSNIAMSIIYYVFIYDIYVLFFYYVYIYIL